MPSAGYDRMKVPLKRDINWSKNAEMFSFFFFMLLVYCLTVTADGECWCVGSASPFKDIYKCLTQSDKSLHSVERLHQ